jgi:diaminohydroxyphosphoribosylaminopyrimidine deaminase/5-amino-6-(5-phosphoribosylamino)uracil reductase
MDDLRFMRRALQLAAYGRGTVSPNPMVGCVIVAEGEIIGEGWHQNYGRGHAEVQAVSNVHERGNGEGLAGATAYVTLEPCSHFGNTPPCADLLIEKKLGRVVICNDDPNPLVAGRGINRLKAAGIDVRSGVLEDEGRELNKRFFTFFERQRPYIILKWAETADGFIAGVDRKPVAISGSLSKVMVHRWRSEEDAILVGATTAIADNPALNVREWTGINPVRIVLDRNLRMPESSRLLDGSQPTLVYNYLKDDQPAGPVPVRYSADHIGSRVAFVKTEPSAQELEWILTNLYQRKIQSVLVEGGAAILNSFLQVGLWDEIRQCQSTKLLGKGIEAPSIKGTFIRSEQAEGDRWSYYQNLER